MNSVFFLAEIKADDVFTETRRSCLLNVGDKAVLVGLIDSVLTVALISSVRVLG